MKIGLVVPGGVDRSGTQRVIPCLLWLIERLAHDHDVHVFALRQEDCAGTYMLLGATVHTVPRPRRLQALHAIVREHLNKRFDVLHALWALPQGVVAAVAGRMLNVPFFLHIAGGELTTLPNIAYGDARTARGRAWLAVAAWAATHVTVPSTAMQALAERSGIAAERLPLGVALDRWPAAPVHTTVHERPRLLHVGSLNRVKDLTTLLQAVHALRARNRTVQLDIVGDDTLHGSIQSQASTLGLDDLVRFHGFLPHHELRPFFDGADLLVVSSRHEAGPVVALEAAVAGVPVVGTRVGTIADWHPHAALAVEPAQPIALAEAIETSLLNGAARIARAIEAQRRAVAEDADFSADRICALASGANWERGRSGKP